MTSAESYKAIESKVDEIRVLGEEFFQAFILFAPWLKTVGGGTYHRKSIWYELSAAKSVHILYELFKVNAMLPEVVSRPPAKRQVFPLRHSFIPAYVQFDLGIVTSHILGMSCKQSRLEYKNPDFWKLHFNHNRNPFQRGTEGRQFDGTFWTDGYGVSILMWTSGEPKSAGQKRKHGQSRKSRNSELFPYFLTVSHQELRRYHDVVFVDPNLRDIMFSMYIDSS